MNVQFFFILNITPPTFFLKKNLASNAQISVDKKTMLAKKHHIMKCPLFPCSISFKVFHLTKVPTYKYGKYMTPLGNIIFLGRKSFQNYIKSLYLLRLFLALNHSGIL